ncbi:MinD/ParA family ATP-binding protein [Planobispora rosea]|uniref:MinD/ParA family ATP-binding protein n=1 Tax=Planobispora rosea TaxID=35762 RepID=UPI000AA64655|nr:MinD/ParA family protein [Planobispora rosea]
MARHDREESLEEQLAWLDAIKEQEEAPAVAVTVAATTADDTVVSPYPQDPWSLVPTEADTTSSPLLRAAAGPEHDIADSSVAVTDPAESRAEAADASEWAEAAEAVSSFTLPPSPPPSPEENDGFLAPLKPLPREEPGSAFGPDSGFGSGFGSDSAFGSGFGSDTGFGSGDTGNHTPGDSTAADREQSRGMFEEPQRADGPSGSYTLPSVQPLTPAAEGSGTTSVDPGTGQPAAKSAAPEADRFSRGDTDPGYGFRRGDTDPGHFAQAQRLTEPAQDRDHFAPKTAEPARSTESSWSEAPSSFRAPESFGSDRPGPAGPSAERPVPGAPGPDPADTGETRVYARDRNAEPAHDGQGAFAVQGETASSMTGFSATGSSVTGSSAAGSSGTGPFATARDTARHDTSDLDISEPDLYRPRRRQSPFGSSSRQDTVSPRPSADSLDPESLLRGRRSGPSGGWRKLIYRASAGLIKPGESPEVRRRQELLSRARTPVASGHHRVAVLSLKGGVGKTTTTVGLGATLAQIRGDRVIAVDANPDRGTLSDKVELETSATVRDLLNERGQIKRYVDIRAFTSQAPSRLEILASDRDPSVSEAFSAADYQTVAQVLENFYSICITDCGTGLLHSAMSGVLGLADQLVLVSSPSVDGARAASATLDWLEAHHYEDLVRSATVVLCSVRPRSKSTIDLDKLEAHFAARCRSVIRVPYDPHLEEGAEIDLDRLQPATRDSYLRLAASVGDGFAPSHP